MSDDKFKERVLRMRQLQKQFLRTKDAIILLESKRAEEEIDKELKNWEEERKGQNLF